MLFPLFIDLSTINVLVVGGGGVAERKVQLLIQAGARVTVMALDLTAQLQTWGAENLLCHLNEPFHKGALESVRLVIAATDDAEVNQAVSRAAEHLGILCNVVDDQELSTCHVPSIVDRSPLLIAVSSAGYAPVLSRRVREQLESVFDEAYGLLANFLASHRALITKRLPDLAARRHFYDTLLDSPILEMLRTGQEFNATAFLESSLEESRSARTGDCAIVGAGPGAAENLTLRALRCLNRADIVISYGSVDETIRAKARRDAQHVHVTPSGTSPEISNIARDGLNNQPADPNSSLLVA